MLVEPLNFEAVIEDVVTDFGRIGQEVRNLYLGRIESVLTSDAFLEGAMRFGRSVPETEGLTFGTLLEKFHEVGRIVIIRNALWRFHLLRREVVACRITGVTCGGQATIPIVWAVSQTAPVIYGEIVASIASKSAGPGTRANIDEFTETTSRGIEQIGGARKGKAIIILNPAEPPLIMRDTVYAFCEDGNEKEITESIHDTVARVAEYVPGYRLLKDPIFDEQKVYMPDLGEFHGLKVTCLLEVEGAGHYLPKYAGNLDIMTSAALQVGEVMARHVVEG